MTDLTTEPLLIVTRCECDRPDCDRVLVAMVRPTIKPLEGHPEELACAVYLPIEAAQGMIDKLREIGLEKGIVLT